MVPMTASPVASTDASCPSTSPGAARRAPRSSARARSASALDPTIHVRRRANAPVTPTVTSAPAATLPRPRSTFARAPALPSTPPVGAVSRVTANVSSERRVTVTRLSWPSLTTAIVTAHDRDAAVESTSHGARSRSQSPPRNDAQRPQDLVGNRGRDVGAAPRSLRRRFHRPARTPRAARRRGTRRFPGRGALRMAEPSGRSPSRHNRAIAPRLRRISDGGTSVRPRARGRRRGRVRRS